MRILDRRLREAEDAIGRLFEPRSASPGRTGLEHLSADELRALRDERRRERDDAVRLTEDYRVSKALMVDGAWPDDVLERWSDGELLAARDLMRDGIRPPRPLRYSPPGHFRR